MAPKIIFVITLTACVLAGAYAADVTTIKHNKGGARLTLYAGDFISGKGGNFEEPGSTSLYEFQVKCTKDGPVVGICSESGIYLASPPPGSSDRQYTNLQIACNLKESCGKFRAGVINVLGYAPGGDWSGLYPVTLNVVGGTGGFDAVRGGKSTWYEDRGEFVLYY